MIVLVVVFSIVKLAQRRKVRLRSKVEKEEINEMYGTYDTSGEHSDYSTVQDTNEYYG